MSYQITLNIAEESEEARLIESVAAREQLSREKAALKLIKGSQNGTDELTKRQKTLAAIESVTGSLQGPDWLWGEFEAERQADIERENARAEL